MAIFSLYLCEQVVDRSVIREIRRRCNGIASTSSDRFGHLF
jgi:hypothetical protein